MNFLDKNPPYCYDYYFCAIFLLDEKNNKIITDATENFGGPDFRPIIKKLSYNSKNLTI